MAKLDILKLKIVSLSPFNDTITMNKILTFTAQLSNEKLNTSCLKMEISSSPHNYVWCMAGIAIPNDIRCKRGDIGLIVYVPWNEHKVFVKYSKNESKNFILNKLSQASNVEELYEKLRFMRCLEMNFDLSSYWMQNS